jgi:hypothetical protein
VSNLVGQGSATLMSAWGDPMAVKTASVWRTLASAKVETLEAPEQHGEGGGGRTMD